MRQGEGQKVNILLLNIDISKEEDKGEQSSLNS